MTLRYLNSVPLNNGGLRILKLESFCFRRIINVIFLSILILFVTSSALVAQTKPERRVYLFDYTGSMKTNKIWETVKTNLINAVNQVDDPTTELIIIPFAETPVTPWKEKATKDGKEKLINKIKSQDAIGQTTNISLAIQQFYNTIDDSYINYMFLLTDGKHEVKKYNLHDDLNLWESKAKGKDVYGFYVMLHENASDQSIVNIINEQENFWVVKSADININIFRLPNKVVYNIRNEHQKTLSINGKLKYAGATEAVLTLESNNYYDLRLVSALIKNGSIVFSLSPKLPLANLPESIDLKVIVSAKNPPKFTFIVPEEISLNVINKKERALIITIEE